MELHSLLEPADKVDTGHLLPDVVTEALKAREEGREESTPEQHDQCNFPGWFERWGQA